MLPNWLMASLFVVAVLVLVHDEFENVELS